MGKQQVGGQRVKKLRGETSISYSLGTPTHQLFVEALRMDGPPGKEHQVERAETRTLRGVNWEELWFGQAACCAEMLIIKYPQLITAWAPLSSQQHFRAHYPCLTWHNVLAYVLLDFSMDL